MAEDKKSLGRVHPEDYKMFWGPEDKGAAKPAFCYPQRVEALEDEVRSMERSLEMGYITAERKMTYAARLEKAKGRLDAINENTERVQNIIAQDPDRWNKRRKELAQDIKRGTPSRSDVKKRHVNPFTVAKIEKGVGGKPGLGALKREYIVISRALGEESNTSFLQRD